MGPAGSSGPLHDSVFSYQIGLPFFLLLCVFRHNFTKTIIPWTDTWSRKTCLAILYKILGATIPVPVVPVYIAFFRHIGLKLGPAVTRYCRADRPRSDQLISNPYRKLYLYRTRFSMRRAPTIVAIFMRGSGISSVR
jgi:hypothetical protein